MKVKVHIPLIVVFVCSMLFASSQSPYHDANKRVAFLEVKDKALVPEGIAVHPSTGRVYLSSLHQNKIVAVNDLGGVTGIISKGQDGFMWGLGIKFSQDGKILWACTADGKGHTKLVGIEHLSGKISKSYTHDSAQFFNDLVILNDETIFITDTETGAVFRLQKDSLQLFLKDEQLKWANGIDATPRGDILFVASGRYGLMKVDVGTKRISSATGNNRVDYAIDGLVLHDSILYAAIGWPQDSIHQHRIIRYHLDAGFRYMSADTLAINQNWLQCPTTLTIHQNQLFSLSATNLGIYNKHGQDIEKILDRLRLPVVAVFQLSEP